MQKAQSFVSACVGIGIAVILMATVMFFTQEGVSASLLHITSTGEGCHIFSSNIKQTVSLFVFRPYPRGHRGVRQIFQVDIRNPDRIDLRNVDPIINQTGEVREATQCLKWGSEDPETENIPQSIRGILASLSRD